MGDDKRSDHLHFGPRDSLLELVVVSQSDLLLISQLALVSEVFQRPKPQIKPLLNSLWTRAKDFSKNLERLHLLVCFFKLDLPQGSSG